MSRPSAASGRNTSILHAIVQAYIETGEPVASRTVASRLRENLSPASIRNIMAELYDEGYLAQPHTSAGRVPTGKAFQSYVQSLSDRPLVASEVQRLQGELRNLDTMQERVERTSHILTEMTNVLGIAATIPSPSQTLDRIDFVALADKRVLMIVATSDHIVRNRVVSLTEAIPQTELESIRNYLNSTFSGWLFSSIQAELAKRLEQDRAAYDAILKRLEILCQKGLLDIDLAPEIHIEGASNLIGVDYHLTQENLRELFRALEQKQRILLLLDRFLEQPDRRVSIRVGLGDAHPAMSELSLIGIAVNLPGGTSGKFAVLGPMRMNYQRVISAVLHVGRAFGTYQA